MIDLYVILYLVSVILMMNIGLEYEKKYNIPAILIVLLYVFLCALVGVVTTYIYMN